MFANLISPHLIASIGQKAVKITLLLIGGEIAKKIISILIKRARLVSEKLDQAALVKRRKRLKTVRSLIINTGKVMINFTIFMMVLSELGVNIAPLITGAGILGLAIGFGAKSLVADLIAGFFIILENQFNIGDQVQIAGHQGKVIRISLRMIILKDKEKKTYIIPNSAAKTIIKFPKKETSHPQGDQR